MKIVILAGGGGTRLWPVSRKNRPKQVQPFIGNKTLLQKTFQRIKSGFKLQDIFISTNYQQYSRIKQQLPKIPRSKYILETTKRDTAAAIGLAAFSIAKKFPTEVIAMANADHFIKNEKEYIRTLKLAEQVLTRYPQYSLLIGIRPTYPETGYGYIKINKLFKQIGNDEIFFGEKFIEKPNLKTASKYIKSWDYLWNSAIFCWRVDRLVNLFKKYLPAHYRLLHKMQPYLGTSQEKRVVQRYFKKFKAISIDYGIMEKTKKLIVIPANFDWADVGHWRTVRDILAAKKSENIVRGQHLSVDSRGNLIYSYTGRLIATVGVKDMIIIETEDCVLVCPKNRAQDVKRVVQKLELKKMEKYL